MSMIFSCKKLEAPKQMYLNQITNVALYLKKRKTKAILHSGFFIFVEIKCHKYQPEEPSCFLFHRALLPDEHHSRSGH